MRQVVTLIPILQIKKQSQRDKYVIYPGSHKQMDAKQHATKQQMDH